jgi:hypothetical protein
MPKVLMQTTVTSTKVSITLCYLCASMKDKKSEMTMLQDMASSGSKRTNTKSNF